MFHLIDAVLTREDLAKCRALIADDLFVDGKETAGFRARRVKKNEQVAQTAAGKTEIQDIVLKGLRASRPFNDVAFPKAIRPPLISRYAQGMEYGLHVDDALMGGAKKDRSDLSLTVFLNDLSDYDGGELIADFGLGQQEVRLPAGCAIVYPSSSLHRVAPVTRGERLVAVSWVQSYVRDPAKRELLNDLRMVRQHLHNQNPDAPETDLAFKSYSNLLRMWAQT